TKQTGRIDHLIAMSENSQAFLQKRPAGIGERVLLSAEDRVVRVAPRAPLNFQPEIVESGVMTHLQLIASFQTEYQFQHLLIVLSPRQARDRGQIAAS